MLYNTGWVESAYNMFKSGHALFVLGRFVDCENGYRDMEDDFGILPLPKWDEDMDYNVTICGSESTFGIPYNSAKTEYIGAIMEQLAYESWKIVTPAYYEQALKVKYTRDNTNKESQVIDLIRNGATFNPAVQLSKLCGNTDYLLAESFRSTTPLASTFESQRSRLETTLADLIETIG